MLILSCCPPLIPAAAAALPGSPRAMVSPAMVSQSGSPDQSVSQSSRRPATCTVQCGILCDGTSGKNPVVVAPMSVFGMHHGREMKALCMRVIVDRWRPTAASKTQTQCSRCQLSGQLCGGCRVPPLPAAPRARPPEAVLCAEGCPEGARGAATELHRAAAACTEARPHSR
jgi:hypothetical protein